MRLVLFIWLFIWLLDVPVANLAASRRGGLFMWSNATDDRTTFERSLAGSYWELCCELLIHIVKARMLGLGIAGAQQRKSPWSLNTDVIDPDHLKWQAKDRPILI